MKNNVGFLESFNGRPSSYINRWCEISDETASAVGVIEAKFVQPLRLVPTNELLLQQCNNGLKKGSVVSCLNALANHRPFMKSVELHYATTN